jgi:hypothetical protein
MKNNCEQKNTMRHLNLVSTPVKAPPAEKPALASLHAGCRYDIGCQDVSVLNSTHGIVGDYRIATQRAEVVPVAKAAKQGEMHSCSFWETDVDLPSLRSYISNDVKDQYLPLEDCLLKGNRMLMNRQELDGPDLAVVDGKTVLSLSPRFDFTFCTDAYTAQLGVIHLVKSTRFITLENGDQINLLNTDIDQAPVLYLGNPQDDYPVSFIAQQQETGIKREYVYRCNISQQIPEEVSHEAVATVTVLEHYFSYFMQRAAPLDDHHNIWIPVYAPISWGWSIRVGRRSDWEWGILKRKLIMPTAGNDGLQLPTWNSNIFSKPGLHG